MSTRSLTYVYEKGKSKPFMALYRHCDGYPSAHARELAGFMKGVKFNDAHCFAASMVKHFKEESGQFYIYHPDCGYVNEAYLYYINPEDDFAAIHSCGGGKLELIFGGSWKKFYAWCDSEECENA